MKATGIIRKVDELGRVVLPKELRTTMDLPTGTSMEIYVDGDRIVLQKYAPGCVFCQTMQNLKPIWDRLVCTDCAVKISKFGFQEG